ncbi:CGNR zinc finger domain-containing protein [Methylobacterium crusticola]|uniref:CGNR zinc finger domain-containing protein n=1 Tax=Methylobacterium crusticola TaxID=1697972 RepID=UPI000FFC878D|nr:ABATE domain-containing protein [Methylobacterium crusticola]
MDHHHTPAIFVADAPGLDFLNSIATPVDTPIDWIGDGEGLLNWLEQAGLVRAATSAAVRDRATPGELDDIAARARQLREWFRGFVDERRGRPLTPEDLPELKPLNRLLERDQRFNQIVSEHDEGVAQLALRTSRHWHTPDSLLQPIAEALAQLVCDENFTHIKACEGHTCTLMFADHTRGRARRWCSMAVCGNRAKQAAHRSRLRT